MHWVCHWFSNLKFTIRSSRLFDIVLVVYGVLAILSKSLWREPYREWKRKALIQSLFLVIVYKLLLLLTAASLLRLGSYFKKFAYSCCLNERDEMKRNETERNETIRIESKRCSSFGPKNANQNLKLISHLNKYLFTFLMEQSWVELSWAELSGTMWRMVGSLLVAPPVAGEPLIYKWTISSDHLVTNLKVFFSKVITNKALSFSILVLSISLLLLPPQVLSFWRLDGDSIIRNSACVDRLQTIQIYRAPFL